MRFTHVISPFQCAPGSEHDIAQRVTLASMQASIAYAGARGIAVEALGIAFCDEPAPVAAPIRFLPQLRRSVLDFKAMKPPRRLPLLADLLAVAEAEGSGDYVIYSNIDISLQPHFYAAVEAMIRSRGEPFACVINRRTISGRFVSAGELPEMYAEAGEKHPGYDCFVFPRQWIKQIDMGNACIGTRHFDGLLIANLDLLSQQRLEIYRDLRLTFHIGNDQSWVSRLDYDEFNMREAIAALRRLAARNAVPAGSHFEFLHAGYMRNAQPHHRFVRLLKRCGPLRRAVGKARGILSRQRNPQ